MVYLEMKFYFDATQPTISHHENGPADNEKNGLLVGPGMSAAIPQLFIHR